jgi:hypothetical protein
MVAAVVSEDSGEAEHFEVDLASLQYLHEEQLMKGLREEGVLWGMEPLEPHHEAQEYQLEIQDLENENAEKKVHSFCSVVHPYLGWTNHQCNQKEQCAPPCRSIEMVRFFSFARDSNAKCFHS